MRMQGSLLRICHVVFGRYFNSKCKAWLRQKSRKWGVIIVRHQLHHWALQRSRLVSESNLICSITVTRTFWHPSQHYMSVIWDESSSLSNLLCYKIFQKAFHVRKNLMGNFIMKFPKIVSIKFENDWKMLTFNHTTTGPCIKCYQINLPRLCGDLQESIVPSWRW